MNMDMDMDLNIDLEMMATSIDNHVEDDTCMELNDTQQSCTRECVCGCDVICVGHDMNPCTRW